VPSIAPKIGFLVPTLQGFGGAERYVIDLLVEVSRRWPVTVITQHEVQPDKIRSAFDIELNPSNIRFLAAPDCHFNSSGGWMQRYRSENAFRNLTRPFDLVFTSTWLVPWSQTAKRGVWICHFPVVSSSLWVNRHVRPGLFSSGARNQLELRRRINSWHTLVTSSHFGQKWIDERWARSSTVLYPSIVSPTEEPPIAQKAPWILACGMFADPDAGSADPYSYKRQELLIECFRRLTCRSELKQWQLHLAGHVQNTAAGRATMERLRGLCEGLNVQFHENCEHAELVELYRRSSCFWHATGYGLDAERAPERMEHFGIVTVEAMSWGCVPVVFGAGGQREIVEPAASGFWWNTTEELVHYTETLALDNSIRHSMAESARRRAKAFGPEVFACKAQLLVDTELRQLGMRTT
jgi:glycosyltransferase involved in cell wall biosynthesis